MATLRYGIPGIGGSLGSCAVCGDTFLYEIMTSQSVDLLSLSGFNKDLPVHKKCAKQVIALQGPWAEIRDKKPIRVKIKGYRSATNYDPCFFLKTGNKAEYLTL